MNVIVVVPCYNEAERLDRQAFVRAMASDENLRLVLVDDGSEDATLDVLRGLAEELGPSAAVLSLPENAGKAEAVRRGVNFALDPERADWSPGAVGYWDADLSTPLDEVPRFVEILEHEPGARAVIGSRVKLMGRHIDRRVWRHYLGRVFATLAALSLGFPVYDTQCGAKLFRVDDDVRRIFQQPFTTRWAFDVELLARIAAIHGREIGSRRVVVELPLRQWKDVSGSKVRASALPRMLVDLVRVYRRYR